VHPVKKRKLARATHLGDYDIVTGPQGFSSIRQISSGEVMHSVNRPSEEARKLYVDQPGLAGRLMASDIQTDELVIWDVGLGAASNAMAVLECFEQGVREQDAEKLRPLRLVSFERDLDPLILAVRFASHFPHLRHGAPHALLSSGEWTHSSGGCTGSCTEAIFLDHLRPPPHPT